MKFLIDVHLPISLSKVLDATPNCTSIHVNQILQRWNTSDQSICKYADENGFVVVSKDSDFLNSHLINKTPRKLIRIILGNISNNDLVTLVSNYLPSILSLDGKDEFYVELSREQIIVIG